MKHLRHIISGVVWTMAGLYFALVILLHIPAVQGGLGSWVSSAIANKLGTKVEIGRVDLGFMNRLIIDDVTILDQKGDKMFTATRLSAKFDYLPLLKGKISLSSAQIFGMSVLLYKNSAQANPNYQFVIDSLAPKDTNKRAPFELRDVSVIVRHGVVTYDNTYMPTSKVFSTNHVHVVDISSHIVVNALAGDLIDVNVKKLALNEASGLRLKSLAFRLTASKGMAKVSDFTAELPGSRLNISSANATFGYDKGKLDARTLRFDGKMERSILTPSDLIFILPQLSDAEYPVSVAAYLSGNGNEINLRGISIYNRENVSLRANGQIYNWRTTPRWAAKVSNLGLSAEGIETITACVGKKFTIPKFVRQLGRIAFHGSVGGYKNALDANGSIKTDAGSALLSLKTQGNNIIGSIETEDLDLKQITGNQSFGYVSTHISVNGSLPHNRQFDLLANGIIDHIDYNGYTYNNLSVNGSAHNSVFSGTLGMNDPNGQININGTVNISDRAPAMKILATVSHLNSHALGISKVLPDALYDFKMNADFTGKTLNTANGTLDITDFTMQSSTKNYSLSEMHIDANNKKSIHTLNMNSDFGTLKVTGQYDYTTLAQSITNMIGSKLPTIPGLPKLMRTYKNDFYLDATINKSDWLQELFNIPLQLNEPLQLSGRISDNEKDLKLNVIVPDFAYAGNKYNGGHMEVITLGDTLKANGHVRKIASDDTWFDLKANAMAANNTLNTSVAFNNPSINGLSGEINSNTNFFKTKGGISSAYVSIQPSKIQIGDSTWHVQPSNIIYSKSNLQVNNFSIQHNGQHISINGLASENAFDSLFVDLKDVDMSYLMELVNFHSVSFDGLATGTAYVSNVFSEPHAMADIVVRDFKFQNSAMGVLSAKVTLNNDERQIDINGIVNDGPGSQVFINGYVSPQRKDIDLAFNTQSTRLGLLNSFCGSFMNSDNLFGTGDLRLYGPLSAINLTGQVVADGSVSITSLNTTYTLRGDTVNFVPNEILFMNDTIFDANGHRGLLTGSLRHENLKNPWYDISVRARNMLAYNFKDFNGKPFYGTIYATGNCDIHGKPGEVTIDVNVTPEENSTLVYNVSSPETLTRNGFIHWDDPNGSVDSTQTSGDSTVNNISAMLKNTPINSTDIHLNFIVNCTPLSTLKLIMDSQTGDYIGLNGSGTIRATYYNKGDFNMFGNYLVDHGIYKLTIQNVIKKDFQFNEGGTIAFEGDPYNASLNLEAQYTVNGVSLSDLNLGNSFSNNVRVNCLMNITGTPNTPKIDFSLDMPTVNADAKQMIYSLINGEEEMNQQVLYLLTIGRFYNQGNNNSSVESADRASQTSMAMQSILSGTITQQINNVLSTVVNNTNWNLGANISTGTEGWNDAEYEGLLSGHLLNNRLLINGQFGYRDNPNATTSFIGDFDVRYLLFPNGNLAIKVYNQANDRYFTKNSLNTQGIGLIIKRDFNGWRDLFGIRPKRTKPKDKK